MIFFRFFRLHIFSSRRIFFVFTKISYLQRFRFPRRKSNFVQKNWQHAKKKFFHIFFCCLSSCVLNFFVKTKFHIYNGLDFPEKNNFRQKTDHTRQKKLYIYIYSTSSRRTDFFLFLPKFHIFRFSQKSPTFGKKNWPQGEKISLLFLILLHILTSKRNFFVFNKSSYLQRFREIIRDTNAKNTNGDQKDPRANKLWALIENKI